MIATPTIQENGQIVIPLTLWKQYGLKKGDKVVLEATPDGLLLNLRETLIMNQFDEIGDGLRQKGVTLEQLMESGAEIRQRIYEEKYAHRTHEA